MEAKKALDIYKKGLVSLEILKLKEMPETEEAAEELYNDLVQTKVYLIDDLEHPYVVRIAYTENKVKMRSVDPEHLPEGDQFELSESIQDILRENGFPVIESAFPQEDDDE